MRRRENARPLGTLERICVVVVLAAFVGLLVWAVLHAGGGVLNQG
jgi:hypothetical protein